MARSFIRLHRIPDRVARDRPIESIPDLAWLGRTFTTERGFAWSQSALRMLQLQLIGTAVYLVSYVLGFSLPGAVLLLVTSAWTIAHSRLHTLDMRQCRELCDRDPVLLGVRALGGFGALPAVCVQALVTARTATPETTEELLALADAWYAQNLGRQDLREVFDALAPEFVGTADELVVTSGSLLSS